MEYTRDMASKVKDIMKHHFIHPSIHLVIHLSYHGLFTPIGQRKSGIQTRRNGLNVLSNTHTPVHYTRLSPITDSIYEGR